MNAVMSSFIEKSKYIVLVLGLVLTLGIVPASTVNAAACSRKPTKPALLTPNNTAFLNVRRVTLEWKATECATRYQVEIRQGTEFGRPWDANYNLTETHYRTRKLETGRTYWWHVQACNRHGCKTSRWGNFTLPQ